MHRRGRRKVRKGKKIDTLDIRHADKVYQFEARMIGTVMEPTFEVVCDPFGIEVENESLKQAIADATDRLRESVEAEWEHVIVVVLEHESRSHVIPRSGDHNGQGFVFSFADIWIMRQNGKYIGFNERGPKYKLDSTEALRPGDISKDWFNSSPGARLILPYSETLIARLAATKDQIKLLYESFHQLMLDSDDLIGLLEGVWPKGCRAAVLAPDVDKIAGELAKIQEKRNKKVSGKKALKKHGFVKKRR